MDMNYRDVITLSIILLILIFTGLRIAEEGLNTTMGINREPRVCNLTINHLRGYDIWLLGKKVYLQKTIKLADFYADRQYLCITWKGQSFMLSPWISLKPAPLSSNLD